MAIDTPIEPTIVESSRLPCEQEPVEIVERKGLGHPDTICDMVMDTVSVALAQAYLKSFGHVLHFNADKGMLVAGQVETREEAEAQDVQEDEAPDHRDAENGAIDSLSGGHGA